jgi:hypothetical protein
MNNFHVLGAVLSVAGAPTAFAAPAPITPVQVHVMAFLPRAGWSVEVDHLGQVSVSHVDVGNTTRALSADEKRELAGLLKRLPTGRKRYSWGTFVVDGTAFELCVGVSSNQRCYTVADALGDDADSRDAERVVKTIWYLRHLVPSDEAAWPPAAE